MDVRIFEAPVPADLDDPEAWALKGAIAVEQAAGAATFGYPDLADTVQEVWAWARLDRYTRHTRLVAVAPTAPGEPDLVVGSAPVSFPDSDNTHLVEGTVYVDPAWRRRGVGAALAGALEDRARAEGRPVISAWTEHGAEPPEPADGAAPDVPFLRAPTGSGRLPLDDGARFASARGFSLAQADRHSVLPLPLAETKVRALEEAANVVAGAEYRVLTWTDTAPADLREGMALLHTRMSTDVPLGELDYREDVWDAERVQEWERTQRAAGRHLLVAAARHVPTGVLAAFTVLLVRDHEPRLVAQDATLVLREHRGRRLGMLVKIANLRALAAAYPEVARVHTWNAEENEHMLAINVALGFRPAGVYGAWQKRLD